LVVAENSLQQNKQTGYVKSKIVCLCERVGMREKKRDNESRKGEKLN